MSIINDLKVEPTNIDIIKIEYSNLFLKVY